MRGCRNAKRIEDHDILTAAVAQGLAGSPARAGSLLRSVAAGADHAWEWKRAEDRFAATLIATDWIDSFRDAVAAAVDADLLGALWGQDALPAA